MSIHTTPHPKAGKTVTIANGTLAGQEFRIEDWWDRVAGRSWMECDGNPACLQYAVRDLELPFDDETVYGKIGGLGFLVHVTELGEAQ